MIKLKSILCFFVLFVFFVVGIVVLFQNNSKALTADDYFRIHIRANSNLEKDQNVKYKVKDEVVNVLTPLLSEAQTKTQALKIVEKNLDVLENTANKVLAEQGFNYKSKAEIKKEFFPTRVYGQLTLESDVYDALILNLGSGTGDNWWCVAFPPMCFVSDVQEGEGVVYKSKILEIIENFFK